MAGYWPTIFAAAVYRFDPPVSSRRNPGRQRVSSGIESASSRNELLLPSSNAPCEYLGGPAAEGVVLGNKVLRPVRFDIRCDAHANGDAGAQKVCSISVIPVELVPPCRLKWNPGLRVQVSRVAASTSTTPSW